MARMTHVEEENIWPVGAILTKKHLDFAHFLETPPSVHMLVTHLTIAQTELEKAFS
jgi:hypothetical protein